MGTQCPHLLSPMYQELQGTGCLLLAITHTVSYWVFLGASCSSFIWAPLLTCAVLLLLALAVVIHRFQRKGLAEHMIHPSPRSLHCPGRDFSMLRALPSYK